MYKEDFQLEITFEEYTKRHYELWVTFTRDKKYIRKRSLDLF